MTTNDEIREMNRMFRQIDKPTDVLSFPMLEYETRESFPDLKNRAKKRIHRIRRADARRHCDLQRKSIGTGRGVRHTPLREFAFLIAHSMLHLFGYDHMEERSVWSWKKDSVRSWKKVQILRA